MDFNLSKGDGENMPGTNNNQCGKWEQMEESDTEQDEHHSSKGATQKFTEWQSPNDYGDGNTDIFNLQRLAMEHRKSPFPDFQFDVLDNEADTDDKGCEYEEATGTKKKPPTRMDSWEDNWLFQQKKCNSKTPTDGRSTLMSMRMYDTIDEQKYRDGEDPDKAESDASDCSDNCKTMEVPRVERPCVRTSSSSSDAEESEESESMDTPSRKSNSNDDDKIPFLESNPSTPGNSDSTDSSGQARQLDDHEAVQDPPPSGPNLTKEKINDLSKITSIADSTKRTERKHAGKMLKTQTAEDIDSDDSIKDGLDRSREEKASCSYSGIPVLPKLLVEKFQSPRPVSGTKSCTSEESSSDEFEKKAAAYKGRRRASWCPLDTPVSAKKRGKRRAPLLPLRVDDDEPELEMKPQSTDAESLVVLERQMLHRNAHHSSFRAKKASPNFVLNPLYVPEGEGAQNPRGLDLLDEPNAMLNLQPSKYESGYSSCSPDSMAIHNNMIFPQQDRRLDMAARHDPSSPTHRRLQPHSGERQADPESSFLW